VIIKPGIGSNLSLTNVLTLKGNKDGPSTFEELLENALKSQQGVSHSKKNTRKKVEKTALAPKDIPTNPKGIDKAQIIGNLSGSDKQVKWKKKQQEEQNELKEFEQLEIQIQKNVDISQQRIAELEKEVRYLKQENTNKQTLEKEISKLKMELVYFVLNMYSSIGKKQRKES
jgi:hypothetical protein